ncbi:MAG: CvpA family protein [Candidatus Marinimicrobia bacterium]|jgi:membrane protein required for colicin V production|nr:CvpA family protein [Candidatus Neomarinimicrobiota bacterium]MBT3617436.1 CvpA family protein [Candidatus Neomarinimicrobiota bacterium]MBT3829376.1 CvpA family protein [Candidatus Neomarinimicrobiota bacterium]MBT3997659.1 CvpA family protein [Candidatus Neomarinimicrobiota bacterium]MBT4280957.1 CvpA family protein [Candidatus Neomarinimicrobiota bacterium]
MEWYLDALAVFFMIGLGLIGYKRGLIEELGRLLGLVLAMIFGFKYYVKISALFLTWLSLDGGVILVLSFALVFVSTLLVVRIVTRMIHLLLMSKGTKWLNRTMGFAFGLIKGGVVLTALLWMTEIFSDSKWSELIMSESRFAGVMQNTRIKTIRIFHWEDPVEMGKLFIQSLVEESTENQSKP